MINGSIHIISYKKDDRKVVVKVWPNRPEFKTWGGIGKYSCFGGEFNIGRPYGLFLLGPAEDQFQITLNDAGYDSRHASAFDRDLFAKLMERYNGKK